MATATNDKPLRLGDLPVVKTNILENAREFDKGVVGGYNGIFPLTAASQGGIYLLPSTGKFYVCETAYNGTQISAPNSNFVELSVWKNHDRLSNLTKHEQINGSFEGLPDNISTSNNPLLMETHIIGNIGFSRVLFQDLSISLTGANKRIIKFHREINIKASTVESIVIDKDNFIEIVIKSDGIYIINSKGNGIFSTIPIYCNCIFLLN